VKVKDTVPNYTRVSCKIRPVCNECNSHDSEISSSNCL